MTDTDLERRLRDAVLKRSAPEASEHQMQLILSRRLAGERVPLPTDPPVAARPLLRWVVVATLGAAASMLAVVRPHASRSSVEAVGTREETGGIGIGPLYAQATDRPTFPLIRPARPLTPGTWRYGMAWGATEPLDSTESWDQQLSLGAYEGVEAYRYRYARHRGTDGSLTDTLWLNRQTLRPIAREAGTATGGHVTQIFQADAVVTGVRTPGGMTSWYSTGLDSLGPRLRGGGRVPAGLYQGGGPVAMWRPQIAATLGAADLGPGWRGSMEALITPFPTFGLRFWLNFEVVGEEQVTVPAGTFNAWKIKVGKKPGLYAWVSKDRQWLLQLQLGTENSPAASRQVLLEARE